MIASHVTKHIFVTGGVVSSLGKGLTAASLGMLLKGRGLRVVMQKLDPYLNVDPGTMNPFQHGEVFVTEDGGECDLDVGHYERFLDVSLSRASNVTTGQVYQSVIERERRGDYEGATVQVIPHVTDEIVSRILNIGGGDVDVVITEVGGTIGDIEGLPFLEAIRQVRQKVGRENTFFVHVSLVPYIAPAKELKTKPTQHSVAALRQAGITPDAIVLRSDRPIETPLKAKIALMCDVDDESVIACPDAKSIYEIPKILHQEGLDAYVVRTLRLHFKDVNWEEWGRVLESTRSSTEEVTVGIVGKYVNLPDAYLSVVSALHSAGFANSAQVKIKWIPADKCLTEKGVQKELSKVDGLVVPGGFGVRDVEGKINALRYARETRIPTLGICLGMQTMIVEVARNLAKLENANSSEFDPDTPHPVIDLMAGQETAVSSGKLGGSMRLGSFPARLTKDSLVASLYESTDVSERHRHRYEVNNDYRAALAGTGLLFSGVNQDLGVVEFVELPQSEHPFYVGTQAHPEFKSRPTAPHPLFTRLVRESVKKKI